MAQNVKLAPGVEIATKKGLYRIEGILALDEFSATNLKTREREVISIAEITFEPEPETLDYVRLTPYNVSEKEWDEAEKEFNAFQELYNNANRTREDVTAFGLVNGMSAATVYRRLDAMRALESPAAMLRKRRRDRPQLELSLLPDGESPRTPEQVVIYEVRRLIKEDRRCTIRKFCSIVLEKCDALKIKKPHANTVRKIAQRLEPGVRLEIFKGRKARQDASAAAGEFPDNDRPFQVYQIDHTKLDVIIVDPETRLPIGRAWITLLIDICPRTIPGFAVSLDAPSVTSISSAIRHAVLRKEQWLKERGINVRWPIFGKPVVLHADNAKEFRGDVLRRVCKANGMDLIWRPVAKPRYGAHIERMNGTLAAILKDLDGATFSNPKQKLDYDAEGNAMMSADEIERWLVHRIAVIYHRSPHSGIENQTPLARLNELVIGRDEKLGCGLPPMVKNERRLYLDFLPRFERVIGREGVRIEGVHYFTDALKSLIGERNLDSPTDSGKWEFARDDRQISPIYFFDPRVDDYVDVPYANLSRPQISSWELDAARKRVKDNGGDPDDEDEIFRAYEECRKIEEAAREKSKAARRRLAQSEERARTKRQDDKLSGAVDESNGAGKTVTGSDHLPASAPARNSGPPVGRKSIFQIEELDE